MGPPRHMCHAKMGFYTVIEFLRLVCKHHIFLLFVRKMEACTGNTNSNYYCKWEFLAQGQEIIGECVNLAIELQ